MAEKQLHCAQIPGAAIDERCSDASERVSSDEAGIESDSSDPLSKQPRAAERTAEFVGHEIEHRETAHSVL